ncbi:MAG: prepilin-type N-terminal cleavage/methylation domain-containing protein [Pseudomonadota bacterium]
MARFSNQLGLSLLELLISLVLMGLISALSYPSLATIFRHWQGIEFENTVADEFAAQRFVRRRLQQLVPIFEREKSTREKLLVFQGDEQKTEFVTPISHFGATATSGLYRVVIKFTDDAGKDSQQLSFYHEIYRPGVEIDLDTVKPVEVIGGVSDGTIRYYSATRKQWRNSWDNYKRLPTAIKIDFGDQDGKQKTWVISIAVAASKRRANSS